MNIKSIGYCSVCDRDFRLCRKAEKGEYLLIHARSRIRFELGGEMISCPEGTVMLFDSRIQQIYGADGNALVYDWICFDTEGDGEFMDSLELETNCLVRCADSEFIGSLTRSIAVEFYSLGSRRNKMLDTLMRTLLIKFSESGLRYESETVQTADPHYSRLIELREKIYRNPQLKWNVDTMAADVNMSRSYFQHIYREVFGVSCISDVISGKIEKAKEILSETGCTVAQVAAMCGYDNEEHFMRQFKKIVGLTPTKYRKQL